MFIHFRLGLRLHGRNSLVMPPFEVSVLYVTLNAAGIVQRAHHDFAGTGSRMMDRIAKGLQDVKKSVTVADELLSARINERG
jgi:hypothetical protein